MQLLVHQQIVPKHYLEEVGTEGFVENPIGTGPFKFVSAKAGLEEVVLERFDDYYGGAPDLEPVGTACVQEAIFRVIPEASTRVAALLAGEVDIIQETHILHRVRPHVGSEFARVHASDVGNELSPLLGLAEDRPRRAPGQEQMLDTVCLSDRGLLQQVLCIILEPCVVPLVALRTVDALPDIIPCALWCLQH